jgi:hypothetical protein
MSTVLPPPAIPIGLSPHAQWLAGEGAGSWFVLMTAPKTDSLYLMDRYDPHGKLECRGLFIAEKNSAGFRIDAPFTITYPSHCARITVLQKGQVFSLIPFPEELLP